MLIKLLKYDFKAMARKMIPIFIAMLVFSCITSLLIGTRPMFQEFIGTRLIVILTIFTFIGSGIMTIVLSVGRFNNSLLKNEGYLSFSLPVSTLEHIIAKVLNALIWGFLEAIAILLSFIIAMTIRGEIRELLNVLSYITRLDFEDFSFVFRILSLITLGIVAEICLIFASISVGHLFKKYSTIVSIATYVAFTILRSYLIPSALFDSNLSYAWHLYMLVLILVATLITWYILDYHLNLD